MNNRKGLTKKIEVLKFEFDKPITGKIAFVEAQCFYKDELMATVKVVYNKKELLNRIRRYTNEKIDLIKIKILKELT